VLLPLDGKLDDLLLESFAHVSGRVDAFVRNEKDAICTFLEDQYFMVHFVATDGDTGMNRAHRDAFSKYEGVNASLGAIVAMLTETEPLKLWPTPDLLHLMKNARARIAKGTLSFDGSSFPICGEALDSELSNKGSMTARSPLDLLKDELALRAFSLDNLIHITLESHDLAGAYFMLPFVCLNLAVRNPRLCSTTRLDLIETAFFVFFSMKRNYPKDANGQGFFINGTKTFWTDVMCTRACNLCVALYWAISTYGAGLSLGRIGTHPVECLFGTTRSVLRGDNRWERFLAAEADAMLVRGILKEEGIDPYIRRFRCVSGHVLSEETADMIRVDFSGMRNRLEVAVAYLIGDPQTWSDYIMGEDSFVWVFGNMFDALGPGYTDNIPQSSPTAGGAIMCRYFAASPRRTGSGDGNQNAGDDVEDGEDEEDDEGDENYE
jgi:hypothetical protein